MQHWTGSPRGYIEFFTLVLAAENRASENNRRCQRRLPVKIFNGGVTQTCKGFCLLEATRSLTIVLYLRTVATMRPPSSLLITKRNKYRWSSSTDHTAALLCAFALFLIKMEKSNAIVLVVFQCVHSWDSFTFSKTIPGIGFAGKGACTIYIVESLLSAVLNCFLYTLFVKRSTLKFVDIEFYSNMLQFFREQ